MWAAVITVFNQPWQLKELPDPRPGPGQVVIRIEASGMCGTDLHVHRGHFSLKAPVVAGHEPVGEVVELGSGVTTLRVGDRVGVHWAQKSCGRCTMCQQERGRYCMRSKSWMELGGGNSELMLAYEQGCALVPKGVSPEAAAPIFCAGYTVMSGLRSATPRPGDRIAVLGIGGLGHLALQFAKALGLETIAITGKASKRDELKALGADHVVVTGEDVGRGLRAIGGADVVLSTTNSANQVGQALSGLRPEGRLVNLGILDAPIQVNAEELMFPGRQIIGGSQAHRRDLIDALELVANGKVRPAVELYPIQRVNEVRDRLEAGHVRYRAVLSHSAR